MSKEFIEKRYNSRSLDKASRQYKQLSYYMTSDIQEDVKVDYFEKYVERKEYNDDIFLNWVKQVFKTKNFISIAKYYRNPNPSSCLINTRVKDPLSRVFFSEDSYFKHVINNEEVVLPTELDDDFQERLLNAVIFNYNDIVVHDLSDVNDPYREFISIDKVISLKMKRSLIDKIAYTAKIELNGEDVYGYAVIDTEKYEFYSKEFDLLKSEPHDLGQCPATFVVKECFDNDLIVKKSLFSHLRADLEEYCFLKTLQRMSNAIGTMPISVRLDTNEIDNSGKDFDVADGEPMSLSQLGSKVSKEARETAGAGGGTIMQAGAEVKLPPTYDKDGAIQMDVVKDFIHFYHMPTEALEFLNKRVIETENKIVSSSLGSFNSSEGKESSMSELQVSKGFVSMEDRLRWLSNTLSYSRGLSDTVMLSLAYGKENINCDIFYGSDFFKESEEKLYEMFAKSPNAIERKNILIRLSQRRNMFNKDKSKREIVLYKIMPYCSDADFVLAVENQMVSPLVFEFQTKFTYWISMFEASYGNISKFWDNTSKLESNKIIEITKLIESIIKTNTNFNTITDGKETTKE